MKTAVVTGGAGFIGTNLASRLIEDGLRVVVLDNLSRRGSQRNLRFLRDTFGRAVHFEHGDVRDAAAVRRAVKGADRVYHLAAQVAVTTSVDDPVDDFEVNLVGTLTLLEELRRLDDPPFLLFTSTNKVYGSLPDLPLELACGRWLPADAGLRANGLSEERPLAFCTPYGCSKGGADQYVLDYAKSFGLPATVFRMSCIYGPHQNGTEDQGWVAHFLIRALEGKPLTIYGDGRQVRDILDVGDAVNAYVRALDNIDQVAGRAFNLGGGPANAVSLLELVDEMGGIIGRDIDLEFEDWRQGDQRWFVADTSSARAALDLPTPRGWRDGVAGLADWLAGERGFSLQPELAAAEG
jgi:CDP-paratose 2-epimerase